MYARLLMAVNIATIQRRTVPSNSSRCSWENRNAQQKKKRKEKKMRFLKKKKERKKCTANEHTGQSIVSGGNKLKMS